MYSWKIADRFHAGIPDAYYAGLTGDLWIEYKWVPKMPKAIKPALSALQLAWLTARQAINFRTAVVVGSPQGHIILAPHEYALKTPTTERLISSKALALWIQSTVDNN